MPDFMPETLHRGQFIGTDAADACGDPAHGFIGEWQMGLVQTGQETDALLRSLVQGIRTDAPETALQAVI